MRKCYNGHYNLSERGEKLYCDNNEFAEEYVSEEHTYECHRFIPGLENEKNYVFYDEQYLGPGYFVINIKEGQIIKFLKIYIMNNNGFPNYAIRAFSINSKDNPEQEFNDISFSFRDIEDDANGLFKIITDLFYQTAGEKVYSIDKLVQGRNNFHSIDNGNVTTLIFSKDVYHGSQHPTDFIDITIGDNYTCNNYKAITSFYNHLAQLSVNTLEEKDIKELLLVRSNVFK